MASRVTVNKGSRGLNKTQIRRLVSEALKILGGFGVPMDNLTLRKKERMAKAFLAVSGLGPTVEWSSVRSHDDGHRLLSRQVLRTMNQYFGENIADSSYDDIRRKDLLLPVEAGVVLRSAGKARASTNDGTRAYALDPLYAAQIKHFGTPEWNTSLATFMGTQSTLADSLKRTRDLTRIPILIGDSQINFSPGEHNQLQKMIIEDFLPRFGHRAEVLYIGDTADKYLYLKVDRLRELGFFEIAHDKLPDVLAYSEREHWLYLVEAVHASNPITELRRRVLEQLTAESKLEIIYVTAFLTRKSFAKFAKDIAWETEVWIAESPDHLIHFNGDKFLGPHKSANSH
jgi:BsuBI/PstI restriction endonuclease domain/BsuBI/PstI restriction endonuclease HTH domain